MANYIDKKTQNEIMFECKKKGYLTAKAVDMFELQARKISNSYDWRNEDDREDAISQAKHDFASYWKNYKINPIGTVKFTRNLYDGETFEVLLNGKHHIYVARMNPKTENDFQIGQKPNITIGNLSKLINQKEGLDYWTSVHKVTKKIAVMDDTCYSESNGVIIINKLLASRVSLKDTNPAIGKSMFKFENSPPAFNFLTSVARNGLFKASKTLYSESQKMMTSFSSINSENGGMFNY